MKFELSSYDCELLLAFEKSLTLQKLADHFGKDPSVLSRQLMSVAQKANVLEKRSGRWFITEKGRALNRWTEETLVSQQQVLNQKIHLRFATTREFSAKILVPEISNLLTKNMTYSVLTSDEGIESLLLSGRADIGIECGRPMDPAIAYKKIAREDIVAVVSAQYFNKSKKVLHQDLLTIPYLRQYRNLDQFYLDHQPQVAADFSDYSSLREACLSGQGWAILPYYQVVNEVEQKKLIVVSDLNFAPLYFGVWWLRDRKTILPFVQNTMKWLSQDHISKRL